VRRPLVLVAVAMAVLALVLATTGPVSAGALTKKAVKKIAAKVVKKSAPKLTVANANALGGLAPSAYTNKAYVYPLTGSGTGGGVLLTWTVTPPPGKYLASFSVSASTTGPATSFSCYVGTPGSRALRSASNDTGTTWWTSGGGYLEVTGAIQLHCDVGGSASTVAVPATSGHAASQLVLTRLDDVSTTPLTTTSP